MHRQRTCTLGLPILENKFLLFKGTNWNQLIGVVYYDSFSIMLWIVSDVYLYQRYIEECFMNGKSDDTM